jgi:prepilin-type N-terminal cleavage/methylation domain-containing protein
MTIVTENSPMPRRTQHDGFTLLEMMVSLAVMLVVAGAAFAALDQSQKVYGTQELQSDMHASLRSAFELMTQEIGQAGSLSLTPTTLSAAVTGGASAQTVNVTSSANMFVGEQLTVDTGATQEVVAIASFPAANQVRGIFTVSHASGVPVSAQGAFPNGILTTAAGNTLQIFGDINANNTLAFVQYDCNPGTSAAPGTLSRSITTLAAGVTTKNASQVLLDNVVSNAGGTSCFTPSMGVGGSVVAGNCTVSAPAYTCVTDMQIMLTVQTSQEDPQTHAFVTETKSFLNISSRNVFCAWAIATAASPTAALLQPTPPGVPLS